jgi:carbonic anhydrase
MAEAGKTATGLTQRISRRQVLCCAACATLGGVSGWLLRGQSWRADPSEAIPENAQQALQRLREGNQRFVDGKVRHGHEDRTRRDALVADQQPFAVVLGCSDSRVPIELVFDQGFGDLFVIRVAGNVIAPDIVGTIGYAVTHLQTRLLVVMGHEGCGAVTAALQSHATQPESPSIEALLKLIGPGLQGLPPELQGSARLSAAVEANVRWSMDQLATIPGGRMVLDSGQLTMLGAVYELATGKVRFLDT